MIQANARIITFKHPIMQDREELVRAALYDPMEIRRSKRDPAVYLYYGTDGPYFICAVVSI